MARPLSANSNAILTSVASSDHPVSVQDLTEEFPGLTRKNIASSLKRLVNRGEIHRVGRGLYYGEAPRTKRKYTRKPKPDPVVTEAIEEITDDEIISMIESTPEFTDIRQADFTEESVLTNQEIDITFTSVEELLDSLCLDGFKVSQLDEATRLRNEIMRNVWLLAELSRGV